MSHIEYLIQTYNILVLILESKLMKYLALLAVYRPNTTEWWFLMAAYSLGPPCVHKSEVINILVRYNINLSL